MEREKALKLGLMCLCVYNTQVYNGFTKVQILKYCEILPFQVTLCTPVPSSHESMVMKPD